jgi:hypothetical protein
MNRSARRVRWILVSTLLAACGGEDAPSGTDDDTSQSPNQPGGAGGGGTSGSSNGASSGEGGLSGDEPLVPAASACGGGARDLAGNLPIVAAKANNYSFSSVLSFPSVAVAPDRELAFDWSGLSRDFLGHELDPLAEIDTVTLILWRMTEQELQTKLNDDELVQRDVAVAATAPTQNALTRVSLFEFGTPGRLPTDPPIGADQILPFLDAAAYDPAEHIYTLMASTGMQIGSGTRMIQSFKLDPASENAEVVMTDASTVLDVSVDLQSLEPTPVPLGDPALTVDWSMMTENALGGEFARNSIGLVAIAHYSESPAELESKFLELVRYDRSIIADRVWLLDVPAGERAMLQGAVGENGAAFEGIDAEGTWMLALFCTQCQNPAPWYLTFLSACPE